MKDYLGFLSIPAIYHTIHASITWPSNHPVGIGAQETGTNAETGFTARNLMSFDSIYVSLVVYLVSLVVG